MSPVNKPPKGAEKLAQKFTAWLGSVSSIIIHTVLFAAAFGLWFFGVDFNTILLVLTTIVSLEAIYLALFIQMTVNRNTQSLEEVEEDVAEMAEDVEDIEENIDKLEETVDDLDEDLDTVQRSIKEIDTDIDTVQASIKDIDQDLEYITEDEQKHGGTDTDIQKALTNIHLALNKLMVEVEKLKEK